ncbi:hypothetical protein JYU14_04870 [Simkania negevensis]|uniref:Uncharacterized protein n=1 Tax=Simkania negevensis TaxID=83561 RepID=A0ABS3ARN7_9BACT|nr:hypothetical protein [Simkania negevensis]
MDGDIARGPDGTHGLEPGTPSEPQKKAPPSFNTRAMVKVREAFNSLQQTPSQLPTRKVFLQHVQDLTKEESEDLQQHATRIAEQIFNQVFSPEAEQTRKLDEARAKVEKAAAEVTDTEAQQGDRLAQAKKTISENIVQPISSAARSAALVAERELGLDPMAQLGKKIAYYETIADRVEQKMGPNMRLGSVDERHVLEYAGKFDMVSTGIAGLTNDPVATSWGPKFFAKSISNLKASGKAGASFFKQIGKFLLAILNLVLPISAIIKKIQGEKVNIAELIPVANFFFRLSKAMKGHDDALSELAQTGIGALSVEFYNLVCRAIDLITCNLCMLLFLDGRNFINGLVGFGSSLCKLVTGFVKAPYDAYKRWEDRCEVVAAKTMDCPAGYRLLKRQALELAETTARSKGTLTARFFEIKSDLKDAYEVHYDKKKAASTAKTEELDQAIKTLEQALLEEAKLDTESEHGRCVHNTEGVPEGLNPFNLMEKLRENIKIPNATSGQQYDLQMCLDMQMTSFIQKMTNEIKPPPTAEEMYAITKGLVDKWTEPANKTVETRDSYADKWNKKIDTDVKISSYANYLNTCFENVSMGMIEAERNTHRLAQQKAIKDAKPPVLGTISGDKSLIERLHKPGEGLLRDRAPERLAANFNQGIKQIFKTHNSPTEVFTAGLASDMLGAWFKNIGRELTNMTICLGHALPAWAGPVLAVIFPPVGIPIVVGKIVQFLSDTAGLSDIVGYGGTFLYLWARAGKETRNELLHIVHPMNGTEGALILAYVAHLAATAMNSVSSMFHHPAMLVGKSSPVHVAVLVFAAAMAAQAAKFCYVFIRELSKGVTAAEAYTLASKGKEYVEATKGSPNEEHVCTTITRIDDEIAANPFAARQSLMIGDSMTNYLIRTGTQFYHAQGALHGHEAPEMAAVWDKGKADAKNNVESLSRVLYESVLEYNKNKETEKKPLATGTVAPDTQTEIFRKILEKKAKTYGFTISELPLDVLPMSDTPYEEERIPLPT